MNTKLIALATIAALTVAALDKDIAEGQVFEVPADQAETLLTQRLAKLADEPLSAPAPKVKTTKARLLQSGLLGQTDDVVDVPNSKLKQLEADGVVDSNKAAVAYALSLKPGAAET